LASPFAIISLCRGEPGDVLNDRPREIVVVATHRRR
jgi:hypothetical protein